MRFPQRRSWAATIFAQWADRDHLQRIWVDRSTEGLDLYSHLGFLYDDWEVLPTVDSDIGDVVANDAEVNRFEEVGSAMEELIGSGSFAWNNARSFLDTRSWTRIAEGSARCLRLLVLNGGCWETEDPSQESDERSGLVRDVPRRAAAAQCLAAIAEGSMSGRSAPFWRPAADAIDELLTRYGLADPEAAVGAVFTDRRDELTRLLDLREATHAAGGTERLGRLADRALWSIVVNGGGWNWDDAARDSPSGSVS